MATKKTQSTLDPVTLSVVWNRLLTLTREIGERVVHSSQSFVMANARDLGPVLLDEKGRIITQVEFLPCHCLLAEIPTKAILDKFGKLEPGDMVLGNDGHIVRSGHLPDWTFLVPIYWHDELVFYCHFRGHMMDTGGAYSGGYFPRAYDCIAEGLNIPPIKLIEKGKIDEKVREVIFNNIRTPEGVWSDVMLIYGSIHRGAEAICELVDKYGLNTVRACCQEMIRKGEEAMRSEIREIPDGEYFGEAAVDWDGSVDRPVWIKVKLTVKGDEMTFDFSDSMKQVDFVNSPLGNTYCYVYMALFLTMDPMMPHNHGALVPIHIIAPEGSVVNPTRPATYGACACSCGCEIYEACSQALGKAVPEKAQGCWSRHMSVDFMGRLPFIDPRTGREIEYFAAPFIEDGGSGARRGFDGWEGMGSTPVPGVLYRGSVEVCEFFLPFKWNVAQIAQDSEGAGEFVGARGVYGERECVAPPGARTILMSGDTSGQYFSSAAQAGAPQVPLAELYIQRAGKKEKSLFRTVDMTEVYTGDLLITKAIGGGGWGNPLDRDAEKVRRDVRDGLVSLQRARDVYGVVIDPEGADDPEKMKVDDKATEQLRRRMRRKGR